MSLVGARLVIHRHADDREDPMSSTTTPNGNTGLRDQLTAIRDELAQARQLRAARVRDRDAAKEAFARADTPPSKMTSDPNFQAGQRAVHAIEQADARLNELQQAELGVLQLLGEAQRA